MTKETEQKVIDGTIWDEFCDALKEAGRIVQSEKAPKDAFNQAEGYRYLTRLLRGGLESFLEFRDPAFPQLRRGAHETIKLGADNPDNRYESAPINPKYDYRITGNRGTVNYLGISSIINKYASGGTMEVTGHIDHRQMDIGPNGELEIILSKTEKPGNWLPLGEDTNSITVRQTFQDRINENRADLKIERIDAGDDRPEPLTPEKLERGLQGAVMFLKGSAHMFENWAESFLPTMNDLPPADQDYCQSIGGDPNIFYFHSAWQLGEDEIMVIDAPEIPECQTWNFQLDNWWMESLDYRHHTIHVNKHTAHYRDDGSVRVVISHTDPGVPNWIETAGHDMGTMCWRWIGADEHPLLNVRVMKLADLASLGLKEMSNEVETVRFDADELVQQAIEQTGFSDFGWFPYREGLEVLLETYDRNVQDPAGRQRCRDRIVNLLATRLRCENAFATIPEIAEQEIVAPVFITGLPRSGTSALLNLMERAPGFRGVLQWEVQFPDPWRGSQPGDEDPRYQPLKKALEAAAGSEFSKIHYVDADTPEECVLLHAFGLHGVHLGFEVMLEPYRSWLLAQDLEPLYRYQKQQLQLLNWRNPGKQWLLKAPAHMWSIETIRKVFPDARFVWCHRDPQKVVPSINSMNRAIMQMYMGDCSHLDAGEVGRSVMEWYAMSLEKGLAERTQLPEELFIDCSQQEFVEQPLQLVERVCEYFDLPLGEEGRASLQAYIDANPKGKHGKHEYNLVEHGLTRELIDERFAFYTTDGRFPISA